MKDNEWEEGLRDRLREGRYIIPEELHQSNLDYSDDWDTLSLELINLPGGDYLVDCYNDEDITPMEDAIDAFLDGNFTKIRVRNGEYGPI